MRVASQVFQTISSLLSRLASSLLNYFPFYTADSCSSISFTQYAQADGLKYWVAVILIGLEQNSGQ